jgi:murein DD-endopeptidase MepM/ murein hydrolase activator NlpD
VKAQGHVSTRRTKRSLRTALALVGLFVAGVVWQAEKPFSQPLTPIAEGGYDVFDRYLRTEIPPAEGFDFPLGDANGRGVYTELKTGQQYRGYYVATRFGERTSLGIHPGEDWNGRGGGNTDLGQPVYAVAAGKVVFADSCGPRWGRVVAIQHVFYENHEKKRICSLYAHLGSLKVKVGDSVHRRQPIGTVGRDPERRYYAHLHLEFRWKESLDPHYWPSSHGKSFDWIRQNYAPPSAFINAHRQLFVPQKESALVLVDHSSYRMRLFREGKQVAEYAVSFGQARGAKRTRGDNRTPKGMYFVVNRYRGAFEGAYGEYFGGHWIKINYPNAYDAARGQANGWITRVKQLEIAKRWRQRKSTLGKSKLGGGIGFHGWKETWRDTGPRHLSWGCIVMHNRDIAKAYSRIQEGTMVVLF